MFIISFLAVQSFFKKFRINLVFYKYRAEAVRNADAVANAADNPTANLCDTGF